MSQSEETLDLLRQQLADQTQKLQALEALCHQIATLAAPIADSTKPVLDIFVKLVPRIPPDANELLAQLSDSLSAQQIHIAKLYACVYAHLQIPGKHNPIDPDKPKPILRPANYDFPDCVKYLEKKLGYQLRDTLGKFKKDSTVQQINQVELRDYWAFLNRYREIRDGGTITIDKELLQLGEPWEQEITKAFIDEFGEEAVYEVYW